MGRQFRESQPKARERSGLDPVYCLPNATACRLGRVPTLTQARVKSISKNHALHENACQSKVLTLSSEVRREHGALSCRGVNLAVFCGKGADPGRLPRVGPSRRPIRGTRVDAPRTCPVSQGLSTSLPSFPRKRSGVRDFGCVSICIAGAALVSGRKGRVQTPVPGLTRRHPGAGRDPSGVQTSGPRQVEAGPGRWLQKPLAVAARRGSRAWIPGLRRNDACP